MGSRILAALAQDARFEVRQELGRRWGTVVYQVRDLVDGAERALKVLDGPRSEGAATLKQLARELRILDRLRHPGLLGIHRRGLAHGRPYLAMELAEAGSAAGWMRRHGPMPIHAALGVVARAAWAVDAAHQGGLVHRHLKPQNLLLTANGAVVGDFATASSLSRPFAAPEQIHGLPVGPAVDIYGLGATLYALMTGSAPWDLRRASRLGLTELHPLVEAEVLRACHPQPHARHPSAASLAMALDQIRRELDTPEPWPAQAPPQPHSLRRLWETWMSR